MQGKLFIEIKNKMDLQIKNAYQTIEMAKASVVKPNDLIPIEPKDIQIGVIVWGVNDEGWYWHIIEEVHNPNSDCKTYCADDGCRYGLNGKFVENLSTID